MQQAPSIINLRQIGHDWTIKQSAKRDSDVTEWERSSHSIPFMSLVDRRATICADRHQRSPRRRCERYCACAVEQVEIGNLWEAVAAANPTPEQNAQFTAVAQLCTAMADEPSP